MLFFVTDVFRAMHQIVGKAAVNVTLTDLSISFFMLVLSFVAFCYLVVEYHMMQIDISHMNVDDRTQTLCEAAIVFSGFLSMLWVGRRHGYL